MMETGTSTGQMFVNLVSLQTESPKGWLSLIPEADDQKSFAIEDTSFSGQIGMAFACWKAKTAVPPDDCPINESRSENDITIGACTCLDILTEKCKVTIDLRQGRLGMVKGDKPLDQSLIQEAFDQAEIVSLTGSELAELKRRL